MKKFCFLLFLFGWAATTAFASVPPNDSTALKTKTLTLTNLLNSSISSIEKVSGRKLTFGERLKLKILRSKYFKSFADERGEPTEKQRRQGKTSMILGIGSIVGLILPVVGLLSLPAAILAIIFGVQSLKGNSNAPGIVGIVTGGVTLILFLLVIALLAAFIS